MKIIAGNWKMNKTASETVDFLRKLKRKNFKGYKIIIFPPFTSLQSAREELKGSKILLGAQNMHFEDSGAFTGEVSAGMLKEIGVEYVLIGHSERRHIFHETDEMVNKKILSALKHGLHPIVCVGETLEEREEGKAKKIIRRQLQNALISIPPQSLLVAYEPVWAIGTGKNATSEQAEEMHTYIYDLLSEDYPGTEILYGGSVTPENAFGLFTQKHVSGVLVGGVSLVFEKLSKIIAH